jgi:hypothetical protein
MNERHIPKEFMFSLMEEKHRTSGKHITAFRILCFGENEQQKMQFLTKMGDNNGDNVVEDNVLLFVKRVQVSIPCANISLLPVSFAIRNVPSTARVSPDDATNYFQHAAGAIFLFDMNDRGSFEKLRNAWISNMRRHSWYGVCILVGIITKVTVKGNENDSIDTAPECALSSEEVVKLANQLDMFYFECNLDESISTTEGDTNYRKNNPTRNISHDGLLCHQYQYTSITIVSLSSYYYYNCILNGHSQ